MKQKKILILGSTGSIGINALEVVAEKREFFQVVGLASHRNESLLLEQATRFGVSHLALSGTISKDPRIEYNGLEGLLHLIEDSDADIVLNGISGAAGFLPSMKAIQTGKHLALANKETLVMAGELVLAEARKQGVSILPVDSEHSAIFQLFTRFDKTSIEAVILTASGGAFRDLPKEQLSSVTPALALNHPTWNMGTKITIDSASLANKGLEVIEAHHLFEMPPERIHVVIHPQSYVHSLVETKDGNFYAQIGKPDMRIPILNALTYPSILSNSIEKLSLYNVQLSFFEPDREKYPMLPLAYHALRRGGAYPLVYNAANEVAVDAFLQGHLPFTGIPQLVDRTLEWCDWPISIEGVEMVLDTDARARSVAQAILSQRKE
ncbi:MAG: 1-deoxy-D-xylulose-5-phosphate reductoisomerase [Spirochaetes bacterium]|nr:1-deoxy-D-xylulose-5-phosphate reductoisomerase [Spirochaetota bacterium]